MLGSRAGRGRGGKMHTERFLLVVKNVVFSIFVDS